MNTSNTLIMALVAAFALTGCAGVVQAVQNQPCELHERQPYTVVEVDPAEHELRMYWRDADGELFGSLEAVRRHVEAGGDSLVAATNAGIFEPGFEPTGLLIIDGAELVPVNRSDGYGNFFLKPNGVFLLTDDGQPRVIATDEWPVAASVTHATQSGPLLVRDGRLHPRFAEGSGSCRLRSGVGVREDGSVVLAISNGAVNFYDFARFFRDELHAPDALYLDGGRSRMLVPAAHRLEDGQFAAIIAVVAVSNENDK